MNTEAFTIQQFCNAHSISRALFYKLIKEGTGPRIAKLGRKRIITRESAAEWRKQIENATEARGE